MNMEVIILLEKDVYRTSVETMNTINKTFDYKR